jgi:hypothetical protein
VPLGCFADPRFAKPSGRQAFEAVLGFAASFDFPDDIVLIETQ